MSSKVTEYVPPFDIVPESKLPSSAVTVCGALSKFVHRIVSPTGIVISLTAKLIPLMSMGCVRGPVVVELFAVISISGGTVVIGSSIASVSSKHPARDAVSIKNIIAKVLLFMVFPKCTIIKTTRQNDTTVVYFHVYEVVATLSLI